MSDFATSFQQSFSGRLPVGPKGDPNRGTAVLGNPRNVAWKSLSVEDKRAVIEALREDSPESFHRVQHIHAMVPRWFDLARKQRELIAKRREQLETLRENAGVGPDGSGDDAEAEAAKELKLAEAQAKRAAERLEAAKDRAQTAKRNAATLRQALDSWFMPSPMNASGSHGPELHVFADECRELWPNAHVDDAITRELGGSIDE